MTTKPTPLVTREALLAFTQQLVEHYAPERVILFGSLARGEARWDSDADILVVTPFEGRHLAKIREVRRLCPVRFPLDLLIRRPEEVEVRYRGGIRSYARRLTMERCCMVEPWSAAESTSAEAGEDLSGQGFLDLVVSGHSFLHTGGGIDPDGM
ncbi:MAG: nucleotidyltransferase domain-containing protein [Cyanobacteriota bacterium]